MPRGRKLGEASRNALHQHALVDLFHFAHGQAAGSGKASTFFLFFGFFFLSFIDFLFFYFKKVVVCWCVGPWVLFYLVSQSSEPTIEEGETCEAKNWRES